MVTGSMARGLEGFESSMEQLREVLPRFRGQKIGEMEQTLGEGLEAVRAAGGEVAERAAIGGYEYDKAAQMAGRRGPEGAPFARTAGEVAVDVAPIPGAEALSLGRRALRGGKVPTPAEIEAARASLQPPKPTGGVENPFIQLEFPDEVMRGRQTEVAAAEAAARLADEQTAARGELEGVAEQQAIYNREMGQPDLFDSRITRTEEFPSSPAEPSLRSKERPLDMTELGMQRQAGPKLQEQEYFGPVDKGVPPEQGVLEFNTEGVEAIKKPGFLRSAEEVMQAREFEKVRVPVVEEGVVSVPKEVKFDAKLKNIARTGNYRAGLEYIRDSKDVPEYLAYLADYLLKDPEFNPRLVTVDKLNAADFKNIKEGEVVGGGFGYPNDVATITFSENSGTIGLATGWLHEGVHAKTALVQVMADANSPHLPRQAREAAETIKGLFEYTKKHASPELMEQYGMRHHMEFIAEAFTNPEFQKMLKDIRYQPRPGEGFLKNVLTMWDAFVHSVSRLLGLDPKRIDVLAATLDQGAKMMRSVDTNAQLKKWVYSPEAIKWQAGVNAAMLGKPLPNKAPKRSHQTKQEFLDGLRKAGKNNEFINRFGKYLYKDYVDKWNSEYGQPKPTVGFDNRPHEEFMKDLYAPDGEMRIDDIDHSWGPSYTESKRHPILNRVHDTATQVENAINNVFDDLYRGQKVESGLGITALRHTKLKESPDSVAAISSRFSNKEIKSVVETVGDMLEKGRIEELLATPEKFLGVNETRFVRALDKMNKEILAGINEIRVKQGIDPIKGRPDWFTSFVRHGKYHVFEIGADGKSTFRKGFDNAKDANRLAAYLRGKGFHNIRVSHAANDPRRTVLPPEAFHEAKKMVETKAERDLLDKAIEEASLRLGTKKFSMARDSKAGGIPLGKSEVEALGYKKTFDNFMFGINQYANSAARYIGANKDGHASRLYEMFNDFKLESDYPNAMNAAKRRWATFQGTDRIFETATKAINVLNRAFLQTSVVAWNPVFYGANVLQFGFAPPRLMLENARTLGGKGNVPLAIMKATHDIYFNNTPEMKAVVRKAVDNGSIEPRFAEALEWKIAEGSNIGAFARTAMLQKVAAASDSLSRLATYLMFYELGKSAKLADSAAHSFAAKESQGIMIQYSKWARMPILKDTPIIGELASPVTSFLTNMAFNVGQYMKTAVAGDKNAGRLLGPILAYMTYQAALSGVKGLPGYEDIDAGMQHLNQWYVEKFGGEWFGTPSELLNSWGANDYVQYGIPTASTGINMTGTLGMGHLIPGVITNVGTPSKMFPGVDFALKAWETISKSALDQTADNMTEDEKQRIVSQIAPGAAKEWIKQAMSEEGFLGAAEGRSVGGDKDLIYQRDASENIKSMITGKQPTSESKARWGQRVFKMEEESIGKAKTTAVQLLADSIQRGKPMSPYVERVISNYPEIVDSIIDKSLKELESRKVPFYERKLMEALESKDLSGPRRLETLQELFNP